MAERQKDGYQTEGLNSPEFDLQTRRHSASHLFSMSVFSVFMSLFSKYLRSIVLPYFLYSIIGVRPFYCFLASAILH